METKGGGPLNARRITYPHLGSYAVAFKPIAALIGEVVVPPPITRRTIELGCAHSPESACIPFKYNLGNFIEALERGANVLVQAGGGCRYGYYGEVQQRILKRLGYTFTFLKLGGNCNLITAARMLKAFEPRLSYYPQIFRAFRLAYRRLKCIDAVEASLRLTVGFEKEQGAGERLHARLLAELDRASTVEDVEELEETCRRAVRAIETDKPPRPLRVGVIGEFYVVIEPFSNFFLEKELARRGMEVHRFVTVTSVLHDALSFGRSNKRHLEHARPYLKHHIGAHGTESVAVAHRLIREGFDGIIHLKPFGCMPEVSAMSALQRMAREYRFPILHFSFDALTSETGVKTRLEAFYDMLMMRNKKRAHEPAST